MSREEQGSARRFSFQQIHSWLNFVRSGEAGIDSLGVSPLVQIGLPASFPTHSTNRSGLCLTSLSSSKIMVFCSVSGLVPLPGRLPSQDVSMADHTPGLLTEISGTQRLSLPSGLSKDHRSFFSWLRLTTDLCMNWPLCPLGKGDSFRLSWVLTLKPRQYRRSPPRHGISLGVHTLICKMEMVTVPVSRTPREEHSRHR